MGEIADDFGTIASDPYMIENIKIRSSKSKFKRP
jgi:hypothetical protein